MNSLKPKGSNHVIKSSDGEANDPRIAKHESNESVSRLTPITITNTGETSTRNALNKYTAIKRIAEGTFGEIWHVINEDTKESFALKKVKEDRSVSSQRIKQRKRNLLEEGRMLRKLSNIRSKDSGNGMIVKCYEILYDDEKQWEEEEIGIGPCIVMDLCGFSLLHYMAYYRSSKKRISFETIRAISVQLLSAMRFMHNVGAMAHADLKPENICFVFDDEMKPCFNRMPRIKIIDLGNAIEIDRKLSSNNYQIQTLWYRAPEVLLGNKDEISCLIDMWSVGCIICELFTVNKAMFACDELSAVAVAHAICNELSLFPVYLYNEIKSMNHKNLFPSYAFHHNETSYLKLKVYRKRRLCKKLGKYINATDTSEFNEFMCFIDFISCLLDLNPFTRYNATDSIQHEFIIYDFVAHSSKNINMQIKPSTADSHERQKKINQLVMEYQASRNNNHNYHNSANPIIKLKKQL